MTDQGKWRKTDGGGQGEEEAIGSRLKKWQKAEG